MFRARSGPDTPSSSLLPIQHPRLAARIPQSFSPLALSTKQHLGAAAARPEEGIPSSNGCQVHCRWPRWLLCHLVRLRLHCFSEEDLWWHHPRDRFRQGVVEGDGAEVPGLAPGCWAARHHEPHQPSEFHRQGPQPLRPKSVRFAVVRKLYRDGDVCFYNLPIRAGCTLKAIWSV